VTPTMDEILTDGGLDHGMIESMVEHTLTKTKEINGVQLSMSGQEEHIMRTGAIVIDDKVCGFEVTREDEDNSVFITVKVETIEWADKQTVSI